MRVLGRKTHTRNESDDMNPQHRRREGVEERRYCRPTALRWRVES